VIQTGENAFCHACHLFATLIDTFLPEACLPVLCMFLHLHRCNCTQLMLAHKYHNLTYLTNESICSHRTKVLEKIMLSDMSWKIHAKAVLPRQVLLGGPIQDLIKFQMVPIPILSVLTYSTSLPHDILKVSKKSNTTCPLGRLNMTIMFCVGLVIGFWWGFD
jgi:hypothetical protein